MIGIRIGYETGTGQIPVSSSDLASVGYDGATLTIVFLSGGVYAYDGVPYEEYLGLMSAGSHGRYFHAHIRNQYNFRRLA